MNTLLIVDDEASVYTDEIRKRKLPDLIVYCAETIQQAEPYISSANIILGSPPLVSPLLSQAKNLRWLQSIYAGIDQLCSEELPKNYLLTGIKDVFGPLMSEYVFSYILAIERSLVKTVRHQVERIWNPIPYRSLTNLTVGIAGLGSIGRHVASTASHFGMTVLGLKRIPDIIPGVDKVYTQQEKHLFLAQLDYLVLTLPATAATYHFLQLEDLLQMKDTSTVISVGRGNNINEKDLIEALNNNHIKGAVLDVFEQEPLIPQSPLWDIPEVYITPHNSAFSFPKQIASIFCENYSRFIDGKELKYIVDFKKGY